MKIGFIGFGEAAYNISLGLRTEGEFEIHAFDSAISLEAFGEQIRRRAAETKVELAASAEALVTWADIVIAAVPSTFTLGVCEQAAPFLKPGQLYVDVSASTPRTKEAVWALLQDKNVLFADAAMMGSLPKDRHKVPITVSGNGAKRFQELMTPYGMKIEYESEKPGDASAIKLVRSIFMKGIAALMIETMQAADAYGVSETVIESLSRSMDGISFRSHLDRLVTGTGIHCVRRGAELKGSVAMLEEAGLSAEMTEASKHCHEALAPYAFAAKFALQKPKGWQDIIEPMRPETEKQ